jgi:hypothetical protein
LVIRDDLQLKHERFCGEKVLEILGISHASFRHGNPDDSEPDLIFKIGDQQIGIEVTSAYPEDDPALPNRHAQAAWQFARNPTFDEHGVHRMPSGADPDKTLASAIQNRLHDKCQKRYQGVNETWLVIYAQTVVTESYELDNALQGRQTPEWHDFARIFILHVTVERGGGYRAHQIFPQVVDYFDARL